MIKVIGVEFPNSVYNKFKEELDARLGESIRTIESNNQISKFITFKIKDMNYLEFNTDSINLENEENQKFIAPDTDEMKDFYEVEIPYVIDKWNVYNNYLLTSLKEDGKNDEEISQYFEDNNLSFDEQIVCKILYI